MKRINLLKQVFLLRKRILLMLLSFSIFFPSLIYAQTNYAITWDTEVSCIDYRQDEKDSEEEILDSECIGVCSGSEVNYSILADNYSGIVSVDWSVTGGDLTSASGTSATVSWGGDGSGSISAEIKLSNGEIITENVCISIKISPEALFTISPFPEPLKDYTACINSDIYFKNLSSTNGGSELYSYKWDFGDGDPTNGIPNSVSYAYEPVFSYPEPGEYIVTLEVTNECGCKAYHKATIIVMKDEIPIDCPSVVCEGEIATYTVPDYIADLCGGYLNWKAFGGDIVNQDFNMVQVIWNNVDETGFGNLALDLSSCDIACDAHISVKVPVIKVKGDIEGKDLICPNEDNVYSLPQWPTTEVEWSIIGAPGMVNMLQTDQRNEIVLQSYGTPGTIYLKAKYKNTLLGCGGEAIKKIKIEAPVTITGDDSFCIGQTGTFNILGGSTENWIIKKPDYTTTVISNQSSINYTFTQEGTYVIDVAGDACSTSPLRVKVKESPEPPTSITGEDEICLDVPHEFSIPSNSEATGEWSITGGVIVGSTSGDEVTAIFDSSYTGGSYEIQCKYVSIEQPYCESAVFTKTLTVKEVNANISGSSLVCPSTYEVYKAQDLFGSMLTDVDSFNWYVDDSSLGGVSLGNGTNEITVLWNQIGAVNQTVELILEVNKCGKIFEFEKEIIIQGSPTFTVSAPSSTCAEDINSFSVSGLSSFDSIEWDFDDGSFASGASVTHDFANIAGGNITRDVVVTIINPNGCDAVITEVHPVIVSPTPNVNISPYNHVTVSDWSTFTYTLTANIQSGFGTTTTIKWYRDNDTNPNNGNVLIATNVTSITSEINAVGNYYAIIENSYGCSTQTDEVNISNCTSPGGGCTPNPSTVNITTSNTGCLTGSSSATFTGLTPVSTQWVTTDSKMNIVGSSTSATANYTFTEPGIYTTHIIANYPSPYCKIEEFKSILIPYVADLKYKVTCSTTPGMYEIELLDDSSYFSAVNLTNYTFSESGTILSSGTNNSVTILRGAGSHTFDLSITGTDGTTIFPSCTASVTIDLDPYPVANFSSDTSVCQGEPIAFNVSSFNPNFQYAWDFSGSGDNFSVNVPDPIVEFENFGMKSITLTVTNPLGCSATFTQTIDVDENGLDGDLHIMPNSTCEGNSVTLAYINTGTTVPSNYYWMSEDQLLAMTTTNTYTANLSSGNYWVEVTDDFGCKRKDIPSKNLTIINKPDIKISGSTDVCSYDFVYLNGSAGSDPGILYEWYRNGAHLTAFDDETNLSFQEINIGTSPFTVTYTLKAKIPNGTGGYCESQKSHIVTVNPKPAPVNLSFNVISCTPYVVEIYASGPTTPGTYTWSDGQSGSAITVTRGGPYQVRFRNSSGCEVTNTIKVPKDPEEFFWIFPKGCYSFCKDYIYGNYPGDPYLIGPNTSFTNWSWIHDGNVTMTGSGYMSNLPLEEPGEYAIKLSNGYCTKDYGTMNLEIESCECKLEVGSKLKNIELNEFDECIFIYDFFISNPMPAFMNATVTVVSGNVTISPSAFGIAPGGSINQNLYINAGQSFPGGYVVLYIEGEIQDKDKTIKCSRLLKLEMQKCTWGREVANDEFISLDKETNIILAPNPTKDFVNIKFNFAEGNNSQKEFEIYDMRGNKVKREVVKENDGVIEWNMNSYASGLYFVIVKENGKVLFKEKLHKE
ncbi:T9SS type A sorting domain-containing protein [Aureivirga marina]|uniref:T9SS type A sorting domain-containing protein n=1 Tax=Aureivirga marina TaxID=1182451 RepID=UPI0018CA4A93|nr:PKD domain-containing protein [Aureivirga marina]